MPRIPRPAIVTVTPGEARRQNDQAWADVVARAPMMARAGVDMVQIRERQLADGVLLALVRQVLGEIDRTKTMVVVNDRPDVAIAAGADGVHLRGDGVRGPRVRAIAPPSFLIGRSVHSPEEARDAEKEGGLDYLLYGTVFPSASKPAGHTVQGLRGLADVCASVQLPVIAIGGVTPETAPSVAAAGAAGIAAIRAFADAAAAEGEMAALVERMRRSFDSGSRVI
jgi:thiamine-phosphate diphosphorylase